VATVLISKTNRASGNGSSTERVGVYVEIEPDQPYYKHRWVDPSSDSGYDWYWVLDSKIHQWFIQAGIPYTLMYEIDWWVEVPDEHALMVKLAWGGEVSLN
jgi:hypothetical protein